MWSEHIAWTIRRGGLFFLVAVSAVSGIDPRTVLAAAPAAPAAPACTLCLYGPDNMAFDKAGNIYLVDSDHKTRSRVLKLSPEGRKLAEWHVFPLTPGRDNSPNDIGLDRDGNVLVTDSLGVMKFSPTGKLLTTIRTDPETYDDQRHVATDGQGHIFVAEALENVIQEFSSDGKLMASWKHDKGAGLDQLDHPEQISVAPDGDLVIQDWGNHRMVIISPSGQAVSAFDATKDVPLRLASISAACVDREGNIYVADYQLYRVQEFDPQGHLLRTIGNTPGKTLFQTAPYSLAMDSHGDLYSADGLSVVKYSRGGRLLARWL